MQCPFIVMLAETDILKAPWNTTIFGTHGVAIPVFLAGKNYCKP